MVCRLGKQKSVTEVQTEESGASFCCERSESPAGGAARTICQELGVDFQGSSAPRHLQRMKYTRRQKLSSHTTGALIYPACLWLLLLH